MNYTIQKIQDCISSSVACINKGGNVYIKSRYGKLTLDLTKYNFNCVTLLFQRIGGNGKILVNDQLYIIASKKMHHQEINISMDKIFNITRPADGLGEVVLMGIILHIKEEDLNLNWKAILSKCADYKGIRLVGNKLLASEGAYISNEKIIHHIKTEPQSAFLRQDDKIIFLISCEITELRTDTDAPVVRSSKDIFESRDAIIELELPKEAVKPALGNRLNIIPYTKSKEAKPVTNMILYDSNACKEFNSAKMGSQNKLVKILLSNGINYLLLRKGGTYSIPTSFARSHIEYIVVITAKRLNGNGRFQVSMNPGSKSEIIIERENSDHYITVRSSSVSNHDGNLVFGLSENGIGEILISRIQILDGIQARSIQSNTNVPHIAAIKATPIFERQVSDKKFVIVIPSYKNSKWCERNIQSCINQNYKKYRVLFIDDNSPDDTYDKVLAVVNKSDKKDKFSIVKNTTRVGALENLYNMIHSCDDNEIVLTLDGDDWLSDENVLNKLNQVYKNENVWMTYGQYKNYPDGGTGVSTLIPDSVIESNSFRRHTWSSSHLRTFYTWLFKKIERKDFMYDGKFFPSAWDQTIMFPMLEMAGYRSKFISDILYIYNLENPINDHKVDQKLQQNLDRVNRGMKKYSKLTSAPAIATEKIKVGLMVIATGKYHQFVQGLISSADNYFLKESEVEVTYYVFSDTKLNINTSRNVVHIHIEHRPFPFASMDRFKHFINNEDKLKTQDFIYYVDVDCLFVDEVPSSEILADLIGVQHCGFVDLRGPVETNTNSAFYTNPNNYKVYYGGGFSGGSLDNYLALSKWCNESIDIDLANGVMPSVHDETAINRYFLDHPPVTLTPSYHYPQSNAAHYKKIWGANKFKPKLLLLDKNHNEIRS